MTIMKTHTKLAITILLFVALQSGQSADLTGKVILNGTPKAEIKIKPTDAFCGKNVRKNFTTRHYVVGQGKGLANVFVYIKSGLKQTNFPTPTTSPLLDQINCEYIPYVLGVQTNQKITIKSSDATLHNVHSSPRVPGNKEFNFAQFLGGKEQKVFVKPEIMVRFKCDVHPWMFAYVGVLDHPYFAVTDKKGNFTIKGLPPGEYVVEAYHVKSHKPKSNPAPTKTVKVDGDTKVNFVVKI